MTASGIKAGDAFLRFFIDDADAKKSLRDFSATVKQTANTIGSIGAAFALTGAALAAPLIKGVSEYAKLETSLSQIGTLLGDNVGLLENYRVQIEAIAKEFGEPTESLARGLYDIISASIPAEKAIDVLRVATQAAAAGMTDVATSADILTTIINSYQLSADDAAKVSDQLFTIVRNGKTTFPELAQSMGQVVSLANTAGVSFEELGSSISTLTRNGAGTTQAITSVRQIIASLLKPTSEAQKAAKELGIEFNSASLASDGLLGTLQKLEGLDTGTLAQFFGSVEALNAVGSLSGDLDGFANDVDALGSSLGATGTAYEQFADDITTANRKATQSVQSLFTAIGDALAPAIKTAQTAFIGAVDAAAAFAGENERLVQTVGLLSVGLTGVGGVLLATSTTLIVVNASIRATVSLVAILRTSMISLTAAAGPLGLALAAIGVAAAIVIGSTTQATAATRDYRAEIEGLNAETQKAFDTDKQRLAILAKLAQQETKTAEEMRITGGIIDDLQGKYPELNLSMDTYRGTVFGVAEAQKLFNGELAQENKLRQLGATLAETSLEINKYVQELKNLGEDESTKELDDQLIQARFRYQELEEQIENVRNGSAKDPIDIGVPSPDELLDANGKVQSALEAYRQLEEDHRRSLLEGREREIDDAKRIGEERRRILSEIIDGETSKGALANGDLVASTTIKLGAVDDGVEQQIADITQKYQDIADNEALVEIQAIENADGEQAFINQQLALQLQFEGFELQKKQLELERQRAVERAKANGESLDLVNQEFDLRAQLIDTSQNGKDIEQKFGSVGSFSSSIADQFQNKSLNLAERTAKATEETARTVKDSQATFG